ncbi:hypothetical protein [Winogradskyella sp. KYW1333]|jgi:hypothetical protein|uniref:hypothetical protein n=1 Tax=Winogradskyella sp. KYW1333 TaxID=2282123 RepID=UPI000DF3836F|nr:hypothetical protein [Winogradskyella sp. KYW1333]RCT54583.1 hypothetical protein DUZ96_06060 [Winogradskyella sp. KYW1333]
MNEDNKEKAMDPLTGEEFVPKRSNQKFASRENQIRYNNLKAKEIRQAKSKTRKILDTNRRVLQIVLGPHNEITRSYDYLLGAGLNFGFNTHTMKMQGVTWTCIDDYAYTRIDANTFKIIKLKV